MERRKILVVDDNTVNLATIEQELKEYYEVVPMISGRRAIKYLYTQKVDLILLDVEMPVKDGIETLQEIRTQDNGVTVPVIFLTANKDRNTVIEGSKLGIMDYITKPFDTDDLVNRIERVFKRLGMVPIGDRELLQTLQKVEDNIIQERIPQAIALSEEIAGYQIDEEIAGRMRNIRTKLSQGDTEVANNTIKRVISMMESRLGIQHSESRNIGNSQLFEKLLGIEHEIENFQTKEALNSCKSILKYNLEKNIKDGIQSISECLMVYDDDGALKLIGSLLRELRSKKE